MKMSEAKRSGDQGKAEKSDSWREIVEGRKRGLKSDVEAGVTPGLDRGGCAERRIREAKNATTKCADCRRISDESIVS
jgi:hypothetical protein